jgi:hypothetical protein
MCSVRNEASSEWRANPRMRFIKRKSLETGQKSRWGKSLQLLDAVFHSLHAQMLYCHAMEGDDGFQDRCGRLEAWNNSIAGHPIGVNP